MSGAPVRERPEDFVYQSNRLTFGELAEHYRAVNATIQRWLRETPNPRPSRRGENLRRDPSTGLRRYELPEIEHA